MSSQAVEKLEDIIQTDFYLFGVLPMAKAPSETMGERITRFRKDKGMTQKELAEALGITQPVVSDYENDVIRIPADAAAELAKILNVSADELLGLKAINQKNTSLKNRRLSRRLHAIDQLPKRDQEALLRTIDAFLSKS